MTTVSMGWSDWSVERMGELFELYADGLAQATTGDVELVTHRPARTYRAFAADHIDVFRV